MYFIVILVCLIKVYDDSDSWSDEYGATVEKILLSHPKNDREKDEEI